MTSAHVSGNTKIILVVAVLLGCTCVLYWHHTNALIAPQLLQAFTLPNEAADSNDDLTTSASKYESYWRHAPRQHPKAARKDVRLNGTYQVSNVAEFVWQLPAEHSAPIGVWLVAHGCGHGAIDFWPKGVGCRSCIGLPEEVNITRTLLGRGYAVVAVSSWDRQGTRCWRSSHQRGIGRGPDIDMVVKLLQKWLPANGLDHLPLYAFGASSGGAFVLHLALGALPLAGVAAQIMAIETSAFQMYMEAFQKQQVQGMHSEAAKVLQLWPLPPALFIHMARDTRTAKTVAEDLAILRNLSVPALEIVLYPAPLTPTLLHEAAPDEVTQEQSQSIFQALKSQGFLTEEHMLASNPRSSAWRKALAQAQVPGLGNLRLQSDASPVAEVLNVLFCGHEMVSRMSTEMIDWFESWTAL